MNLPSVGFNSKIFELRFCQRELKLAFKVSQRRKTCEQSSTSSLQKRAKCAVSFAKPGDTTIQAVVCYQTHLLMQVLHKVRKLVRNRNRPEAERMIRRLLGPVSDHIYILLGTFF